MVDLINDGGSRYYSFNFVNLYYGRKGMVEFRRPPGSVRSVEGTSWAELMESFYLAALNVPCIEDYGRDVAGLGRFVELGLGPHSNPDLFVSIFANKDGSMDPLLLGELSASDTQAFEQKTIQDERGNLMLEKFRDYID